MSFIDLTSSEYSDLTQYGVLAEAALVVAPTSGAIVVNSGYWYGIALVGTFTAGTSPSGLNNTISSSASDQLDILIQEIVSVTSTLTNENIGSGGTGRTFSPGISYTGSGITYTGQAIIFDGEGDINSQFFITDNGTGITFTNTTFSLIGGAKPCNIFWLANNNTTGEFTATNSSVPGIIITTGDFLTTSNAAPSISLTGHIFCKGSADFTRSGEGELTINSTSCGRIVCYAKGTLILTKRGFVPIENIRAGYNVITKGKIYNSEYVKNDANLKIEPVVWVSKFKVINLNSKSRPICIKKDALGKNYPFKDLYVSPGHSLLLNSKMVLAKDIVNGKTIYQDNECDDVEYYHVECENHSAIFANGVLSESYLDANNRDVFENSIKLRRKNILKRNNLKKNMFFKIHLNN